MTEPAVDHPYLRAMFADLELTPDEIRAFTTRRTREKGAEHTSNLAPPQTLPGLEAAC